MCRDSASVKLFLHEVFIYLFIYLFIYFLFRTGFCWSYHIAHSVIFIGRIPTGTGSHPSLSYVDGFYYAGRNHPLILVSSNNLLIQSLRLWPLMRWIETGSKACLAIKNLAFQNENSLRRQFTLVHTAGKLDYLSCSCEVFSWLPMLFYILLWMQPRQRGLINVNIQDK